MVRSLYLLVVGGTRDASTASLHCLKGYIGTGNQLVLIVSSAMSVRNISLQKRHLLILIGYDVCRIWKEKYNDPSHPKR